MEMQIRSLIVSRHISFRQALKAYLEGMDAIEAVETAADGEQASKLNETFGPHLLIVDSGSEGMQTLERSCRCGRQENRVTAVFYSMFEPELYLTGKWKWADACFLQEDLFERLPQIVCGLVEP
jgi:DNA-binding NarL/FixJ family response regulator